MQYEGEIFALKWGKFSLLTHRTTNPGAQYRRIVTDCRPQRGSWTWGLRTCGVRVYVPPITAAMRSGRDRWRERTYSGKMACTAPWSAALRFFQSLNEVPVGCDQLVCAQSSATNVQCGSNKGIAHIRPLNSPTVHGCREPWSSGVCFVTRTTILLKFWPLWLGNIWGERTTSFFPHAYSDYISDMVFAQPSHTPWLSTLTGNLSRKFCSCRRLFLPPPPFCWNSHQV